MSKVSENKIKSAEVVQFINKLNSSDAKKLIRFKGLFDKNSDGKINDSNIGKETVLFENFLYNASEYNAKFKTIIKNLNNLSKEEYENLKEYLTKNNGKLPEWFLSEVKQIKKEEKKYSKNLHVSGENETFSTVREFQYFADDIGYHRMREHEIHEKLIELSIQQNQEIKTAQIPNTEAHTKFVTDENNQPILTVYYDSNDNINGYYENKEGILHAFEHVVETKTDASNNEIEIHKNIEKVTNDDNQLLSETIYNGEYKTDEFQHDEKGRIAKQIRYNIDVNNSVNNISEYTYNEDNSYSETWTPNINTEDKAIYLEKGITTKIVNEYGSDKKKIKEITYSGDKKTHEILFDSDGNIKTKKNYDLLTGALQSTEDVSPQKLGKMEETMLKPEDFLIPEIVKPDDADTTDNIDTDADKDDTPQPKPKTKLKSQGARSTFKDMTLKDLREKSEYIRNLKNGYIEDINDLIKIIETPDSSKLLAGEKYADTPYADNGVKILTSVLTKMKSPKMTPAERTRSMDFIQKMITNEDYYIRNSYIDKPNGKLDKARFQNETGNCWLLETANGLNRKPKGRELLDEILEPDPKTDGAIVHLAGGKKHYRITLKQLAEAFPLSSGEYDMRAIEIAINRYKNDTNALGYINTGETDYTSTTGGTAHEALEAITGNKTLTASVENGVLGVKIDNEFVPINKENAQRLRRIPLTIPASTKNLEMLKQYGDDIVIYTGLSGHEYSMDFNEYGDLNTYEPHNSNNVLTFATKEIASRSAAKEIDIMFL